AELTGHVTPTCGTTSAFLSAGDAAINPNPCAAGVARPPVPPVSTSLPPEPNTDPTAIAQLVGTGGAACSPVATYPTISVGPKIVGTGLGGAPIKDASGFYHFKPSCYGYLDMGGLAGGVSNVQIGPENIPLNKKTADATLVNPAKAGDFLVVTVHSDKPNQTVNPPPNWNSAVFASQGGVGRNQIFYYNADPAGVTTATFTTAGASNLTVQMSEWSGVKVAAPERTGTFATATAATTATVTANPVSANDLIITSDGYLLSAGQTFTPQAGWTTATNDAASGFSSEYRLDIPAGAASETVTTSQATKWSLAVAAFKSKGNVTPAVLDPGFYYFNGHGFSGSGGGICLNGAGLLAKDVTLEFVNQAGFSSGTCDVGGGAACAGTCQFGSTPCSIQACPPNVPAPPTNLTWFAAPCSSAPVADAASCLGASSWCPAGDRACSNVLIWAPAINTGEISLKGAAVHDWLFGSIFWPGRCTDTVNGNSTIAGTVQCGILSISAGPGTGTAIGGDYGISTALVEAVLIE
ncbi:MAG: hypothetical protein ACREOM_12150, partial [Candidatus Dormibacteraceae bacterium]